MFGVKSWLSNTYLALNVCAVGYLGQGFRQFGVQLGWQKNCFVMFKALF